jgi:thioredoxin-related protein
MNRLTQDAKAIIVIILLSIVAYHYDKNHKPIIVNPIPVVNPVVIPEPEIDPSNNVCDLSLKKALEDHKNLVIVFTAEWCGYCKSLKKDLSNLTEDRYEICVVDIDAKENKELSDHFKIKLVPTSVMVDPKENKEIKRVEGYLKDKYINWLK